MLIVVDLPFPPFPNSDQKNSVEFKLTNNSANDWIFHINLGHFIQAFHGFDHERGFSLVVHLRNEFMMRDQSGHVFAFFFDNVISFLVDSSNLM